MPVLMSNSSSTLIVELIDGQVYIFVLYLEQGWLDILIFTFFVHTWCVLVVYPFAVMGIICCASIILLLLQCCGCLMKSVLCLMVLIIIVLLRKSLFVCSTSAKSAAVSTKLQPPSCLVCCGKLELLPRPGTFNKLLSTVHALSLFSFS